VPVHGPERLEEAVWEELGTERRGPGVEAAEPDIVGKHDAALPPAQEMKSLGVELAVPEAEDD
jgi:hypothetical protein